MDIARYCGLQGKDCLTLVASSKGFWGVGSNCVTAITHKAKGFPQGLASSVALSELMVSVLLHKLEATCRVETICYVDDIHIVTTERSQLQRAIIILKQDATDLMLELSPERSLLWGSCMTGLQEAPSEEAFPVTMCLSSMGYEWDLGLSGPDARPERKKTTKRLEKLICRLNDCRISLPRWESKPVP